jgi:hypothetical protein
MKELLAPAPLEQWLRWLREHKLFQPAQSPTHLPTTSTRAKLTVLQTAGTSSGRIKTILQIAYPDPIDAQ